MWNCKASEGTEMVCLPWGICTLCDMQSIEYHIRYSIYSVLHNQSIVSEQKASSLPCGDGRISEKGSSLKVTLYGLPMECERERLIVLT